MKYIIASHTAIIQSGWKPASRDVVDGRVVVNENELRYRYPQDESLEYSAARVDGVVVTRNEALDFLSSRKTFEQIKNKSQE